MNLRKLQGMLLAITAVASLGAKKDKDSVLDSINRRVAKIQACVCPGPEAATYDYIVVGAGTAGASLAWALSNNFGNSVLVLEAGQNRTADPIVTAGSFTQNTQELAWNPKYGVNTNVNDFVNFPTGNGTEPFGTGKGWGGSSSHNYMVAVRGTGDVYDSWAATSGDNRWLYNNLLPYMKFMENFTPGAGCPPVDTTQRGTSGPLQMTQLSPFFFDTPAQIAFNNAFASQMGSVNSQGNATITGADYQLVNNNLGVYPIEAFNDQSLVNRTSAATAFLNASIVTANGIGVGGRQLTIQSGATVNKVLFTGNVATSVAYIQDGVSKQANARKQIILSAGVPASAAILERSGVGDPAVLNPLGIPVIVANPNVGLGLRNTVGVVALISTPTSLPGVNDLLPAIAFADGSTVPAFGFGVADAGSRNFQFISEGLNYFASVAPAPIIPSGLSPLVTPTGKYIGFLGWNLRQKSSGPCHIISSDPFDWPLINFGFYTDTGSATAAPGSDMAAAQAMLAIIQNIAHANGQVLVYPGESVIQQTPNVAEIATVQSQLVDPNATPNHYVGTCNMGTSIANSVVSGKLGVWGTEHLMVADNCVAPATETGNTSYEAYVIGLVAANILGQFNP